MTGWEKSLSVTGTLKRRVSKLNSNCYHCNMEKEVQIIQKALTVVPTKMTHHFLGLGIHKSSCEVEIYELNGVAFVLLVDTGNGTSVTNSAGQLVQEVYLKHLIYKYRKEQLVFAETYKRDERDSGAGLGSVDVITPIWNGDSVRGVEWKRLGELTEPKFKTK